MATLARPQNALCNGYRKSFFQRGELNLFICLQHLLGTAVTQASCHHRCCQSLVGWAEGLSFWTLALPQRGPPGGSSQHDPEGFPTSSGEDRAFPLELDQFHMMVQNASQTYNFVCDHNFWMRFLEKRDLWSCLVQLDESTGLLLTSPSFDKLVQGRRKKLLFESWWHSGCCDPTLLTRIE